jgi:rubrerythrin
VAQLTDEREGVDEPVARFRCSGCGYGVSRSMAPERCPMCGGTVWDFEEPTREDSA